MAIDTAQKRFSMMNLNGTVGFVPLYVPNSGGIDTAYERMQWLLLYNMSTGGTSVIIDRRRRSEAAAYILQMFGLVP